jgi:hypothetical protein
MVFVRGNKSGARENSRGFEQIADDIGDVPAADIFPDGDQ